jgi:hypothetical protein
MMCVMNYLLKPVPYKTSHGSHTQNANPKEVILVPVNLWFFFINYLYITKVCDVCDIDQSKNSRGLIAHRSPSLFVRNTCGWAKSLVCLHGVVCLIFKAPSLRGLLQCKHLSKIRHAVALI